LILAERDVDNALTSVQRDLWKRAMKPFGFVGIGNKWRFANLLRGLALIRTYFGLVGNIFLLMLVPIAGEGGVPNDAECHRPDGCISRSSSSSSSPQDAKQPDRGVSPSDFSSLGSTFQSLESRAQREQSQREREAIEQQLEQLRRTESAQHCPQFVEANGKRHSIAEVINQYGKASKALVDAKATLQQLLAQGECSEMGDAQGCIASIKLWEGLVRALECHVGAGVPLSSGQLVSAQAVSESSSKDLLNMLDTPSGSKAPANSKMSTSKSPGVSSKRDQPSAGASTFPTPYCQFVSDAKYRHDVKRLACISGEVYECRDRSSNDPRTAWSKIVSGGCGGVRSIESVEQELFDLEQLSRSINEDGG